MSPDEPVRKEKLTDIARHIYHLSCYNDFYTLFKARQAAKLLFDDIDQVVKIPPPTSLKIDTNSKWPEFKISNSPTPSSPPKHCFAPLPTRKDALTLINILNDVFGLCKMPSIVDQPQKAANCTYLQMGSCPAPCLGKIPKQKYLKQIDQAIETLTNGPQNQIQMLDSKMKYCASQTQFEKAAALKNKIEQLQKLNRKSYKWLTPLRKLTILHIDKWKPIKIKRKKLASLKSFIITPSSIDLSDHYTIDKIDPMIDQTEKILNQPHQKTEKIKTPETVSLLCRFLCRKNSPGLWINLSGTPHLNKEKIKQHILKKFN